MKLAKIHTNICISPAAPTPNVQCNEIQLFLIFYLHDESLRNPEETPISNIGIDKIVRFHFKKYNKFQFGKLEMSKLEEHPYFDLGLEPHNIYEVINSDWIPESENQSTSKSELKHLIFTFKDSYFEIISTEYKIILKTEETIKEELYYIANQL